MILRLPSDEAAVQMFRDAKYEMQSALQGCIVGYKNISTLIVMHRVHYALSLIHI